MRFFFGTTPGHDVTFDEQRPDGVYVYIRRWVNATIACGVSVKEGWLSALEKENDICVWRLEPRGDPYTRVIGSIIIEEWEFRINYGWYEGSDPMMCDNRSAGLFLHKDAEDSCVYLTMGDHTLRFPYMHENKWGQPRENVRPTSWSRILEDVS